MDASKFEGYGTLEQRDVAVTRVATPRWARIAFVGLTISLAGFVCFMFAGQTDSRPFYIADVSSDLDHQCPIWPRFCLERDECITKFHDGDKANPVKPSECPDYVADCKYYCKECDCQDPEHKYCDSLLSACINQDLGKYVKGSQSVEFDAPKCPYGFVQVGPLGAGISGCGIDTCSIVSSARSVEDCAVLCTESSECVTFSYYTELNGFPACYRYTETESTTVSSLGAASHRIMCTQIAAPTAQLNPYATWKVIGNTFVQDDPWYPACPSGSTVFGLAKGGFCCSGTCAFGAEGDADDDVICAIAGNAAPIWNGAATDFCTGYDENSFAMWAYGMKQAENFNDRTDYIIRADVSFHGESAGISFRQQSSTDPNSQRLVLNFQGGSNFEKYATMSCFDASGTETKNLLASTRCCRVCESTEVACGDTCIASDATCSSSALDGCACNSNGGTTTTISLAVEIGTVSSNPADEAALIAAVDTAVAASDACRVESPDLGGFNKRSLCGGGSSNIGFKITALFDAPVDGDYVFDFNVDFGWGGVVYFDDVVSTKGYQGGNMWWSGNYNIPMALDMTQTLTAGQHTMVIYGAEGCCDGSGHIRFQTPLDDEDVWHMLTVTSLEEMKPWSPAPLREDRLYSVEIRVEGNEVDVEIDGEAYATWMTDCSAAGGIGLQTWKASMMVHNLEWTYISGVSEILGDYEGYFQGASDWKLYVDGELSNSGNAGVESALIVKPTASVIAVELEASTLGSTVTCSLTIDNKLSFVKYKGVSLKITGNKNRWTTVKRFSFSDAGPQAFLEIKGAESSNCHGCRCSGLGLYCTSTDSTSAWNGFSSNTNDWEALGMDYDGFESCPMEAGFCVTADGSDQNSGVKRINRVNGNTDQAEGVCLTRCLSTEGATGCEVIWDQGNRGCYVHKRAVARGNGVDRHSCWIFSKCASQDDSTGAHSQLDYEEVCTSTSGFSLKGQAFKGKYTKIWPKDGKKWAMFRGSPYMDHEDTIPPEAGFALAATSGFGTYNFPDCKPGCVAPHLITEQTGAQESNRIYRVNGQCVLTISECVGCLEALESASTPNIADYPNDFQAIECGSDITSKTADNWKCTQGMAPPRADSDGNEWFSADYDRSSWGDAAAPPALAQTAVGYETSKVLSSSGTGWLGYAKGTADGTNETVTCEYTIDNKVLDVRYDGVLISSKPDSWNSWTAVKSFTFNDRGSDAFLELDGYNSENRGCNTGGLGLTCTSSLSAADGSLWDGFTSDTVHWKAFGARTASFAGKLDMDDVCTSTSGFSLVGSSVAYTKIWAGNADDNMRYARFQGSPYRGGNQYCVYTLPVVA